MFCKSCLIICLNKMIKLRFPHISIIINYNIIIYFRVFIKIRFNFFSSWT